MSARTSSIPIQQSDSWQVVDAFFEEHGLVRQQIDSYNDFITTKVQQVVNEYSTLEFLPDKSPRNGRPNMVWHSIHFTYTRYCTIS